MSRNYKFHNPDGVYFVSFAIVDWLNVFVEPEYVEIIIESLNLCQERKGMEIFAWCIMPNHIHLMFRSSSNQEPGLPLGDFKRFTSKAIVKSLIRKPETKRNYEYINVFLRKGTKSSNVNKYQFWQHDNKPIELWSNKVISEKLRYIHYNPVEAGIVQYPEDYKYSSARDYTGEMGLVRNVIFVDY